MPNLISHTDVFILGFERLYVEWHALFNGVVEIGGYHLSNNDDVKFMWERVCTV